MRKHVTWRIGDGATPSAEAILEIGCDVTILANYGSVAPPTEPVTSGHWDDVVYDSLTDTTTFTDAGTPFPVGAINWWLQPDAARSTYLDIISAGTGQIVVAGNATQLAHGLIPQLPLDPILGTFYCIVWPVGVDPATGTLAHADPCNPASRLLFAGYYYMPPVAGTTVPPSGGSPGVYGKQTGDNYGGDYYCVNRIFDPGSGRWTTPDPAASPSSNLQDYVGSNPIQGTDPSGLFMYWDHDGITERALTLTNVPACLHRQIMRGSQRIDWTHGDVRAFHVDDTRMLGDTEAWLKAVKAAGEHIRAQNGKVSCECLASLARIAGMGAHTIQDFYHHTDWFFGAGGDIRSSQNALIGLGRWDETKQGASAVRTGSGWVFYGAYEGQRRAEARVGDWGHDPWGSKGPPPPLGYNKAGYLQKVIADVVVPHTGSFLQEVIGNMNVGCCCPNGELKSSPGTLTSSSHLTECFGSEAGGTLAKYLAKRHTSNTQLEK